jgi:multidrug efflux pump subunit AcrA (membrane-fusion protein)
VHVTRKVLVALILIAGVVGGVAWWYRQRSRPSAPDAPDTSRASRRDFSITVEATGEVKPQIGAEVRVGARISGKVVRLHANLRDRVEKGQVIAELEQEELQATVDERRAELQLARADLESVIQLSPRETERAEAEVARWKATVDLAQKELDRQDELLRQEFISQQTRDEAQERLLVAQAQLKASQKTLDVVSTTYAEKKKQASAEIARAEAALVNAETRLSYATITAPISGVIGSVATQEGETVAAGLNAPTFVTIVDLARLQVDAYIDEVDIGKVEVGQQAVFTVDAFPAKEFQGEVVAIYPKAIIQDNIVKYVAAVEIDTPYEGDLRPEMTAAVDIMLESRIVLAIPTKAVKRESGRNVVYVRGEDGLETRQVKVGWKSGAWVEVVSGLAEGEEVFLEMPGDDSR